MIIVITGNYGCISRGWSHFQGVESLASIGVAIDVLFASLEFFISFMLFVSLSFHMV